MKVAVTMAWLALAAAPMDAQQMFWPRPERTVFREAMSDVRIHRVGGYPVVDVRVNGQAFRFGLETGGSFIGVSTRLAEALRLAVTSTEISAAAGPRATTTLDSLQLGGVVLHGVRASVSDNFIARGWDGIVSPPLLREVLYTIDLRNNVLRLERGALPSVDHRSVLAISRKDRGNRIDFPLDLGGAVVDAVLDTQSSFDLIVSDSLEPRLRFAGALTSLGQASGPSQGTFTLRGGRLAAEARLGNVMLTALPVVLRDRSGPIAGIAFLEQFIITVDDANGRVRFVPHASPVRFAASWEGTDARMARTAQQGGSTGRFLMGLRTSGTPATVIAVAPGSNIERAGIRVGDVLLEVAGTPIERMTRELWQRVLGDGSPVPVTLSRDNQRFNTSVVPILREVTGQRAPDA